MRSLIVFYSLNGNTEFIAETVAQFINADIVALKTRIPYPTQGFQKYFRGVKSVILKEKPQLVNLPINLALYDTLIIATPVWAGCYAPAVRTFIARNKIENKHIALIACHGGGGGEKCLGSLKEHLEKNNTIIGEISFLEPYKDPGENIQKAKSWAAGLSV